MSDIRREWEERFDSLFDPGHRPIPFRGDARQWTHGVSARLDVLGALKALPDYGQGATVTVTTREGHSYSFDAEYLRLCIGRPVETTADGDVIGAQQMVTRLVAYTHGAPTREAQES